MNLLKNPYFLLTEEGDRMTIAYRDKIKNLPFIIALIGLGGFLIFLSINNEDTFTNVIFIISAVIAFVAAIQLILIQFYWKLEIKEDKLFLRRKLGKWKEIENPVMVRTEAAYNKPILNGRGRKFFYSRIVLGFPNNVEKILLTSEGSFEVPRHDIRHHACKDLSKWLGNRLNLSVEINDVPTIASGEARRTLY